MSDEPEVTGVNYSEYWKERDENGMTENLHPWWSGSRSDW